MKQPAPQPFSPHTLVIECDDSTIEMLRRGQRKDARGMRGVEAVVLRKGCSQGWGGVWLAVSFPAERFADVMRAYLEYEGSLPLTQIVHEYLLCLCCGGYECWPRPILNYVRPLQ